MRQHIFLILVFVITLSSCDDFLDKTPIDQIASEEYFDNQNSAEAAVLGIYRLMESPFYYGQSMIIVPEFAAGHVRHAMSYPEYVNFQSNEIRIDNPWVANIWAQSYSIINAANNVIEQVPLMNNFTAEEFQAQLIREAKFLRALTYFNMVRSWGDVPLITLPTTSSSNFNVSRTQAHVVYENIIEDLRDAVNLPRSYNGSESINKGRATQYAAKALLAKVYLYAGNDNMAIFYAKDVIENGGYLPVDDYGSIWLNENSSESIFELQFDEQGTNTLASVSNPTGAALFFASDKVYNMFEPNDQRRDFTINTENDIKYIGKFRNYNPATQNVPVIRLSEIFLIYAEALARVNMSQLGEPYLYYKKIRDRAGLTTPDETTYDLNSFINAVQREKRLELMFEGEAWYDYTRTGLALTEMMETPSQDRFIFPIPQGERELNKNLGQNSAYE
ncbi:RagB/SusD family nutrient uptake outer membrane protein [Chryseosolibacter indicus]|uniref:RagB/SusD family nutrient uptake outer membrane protein n=1 Tax=Chryseosolibacter indicus TaxID=2782351 RepID=A0ABS5VV50_9BACT|nr:RagB/SusD family nutrient uptake outer membrane protein [Chryseosolibacter indicus]MBT1704744.1 RagB/SusD family nutrient uptake outer membrane protein [Chryseosolibacter indicus]